MNDDCKLLIVALRDLRKRSRFIYKPLMDSGIDVNVFVDDKSTVLFVLKSLFQVRRRRYTHILVLGGNVKNLLWYLIARVMGAQYIVRLGGDPLEAGRSKLVLYKQKNKFFLIAKFYVNQYASKFLLRNADKVVVVNECISMQLCDYINCEIFVIPQFVDIPTIDPNSRAYDSTAINCLCITNLGYKEKATSLIKTIGFLQEYCASQADINIILDIAGGGEFEDIVYKFLDKLTVTQNLKINFHGYVGSVNELYSKADIFLYASELDATPNSILEAKSYALPVIANNAPQFESMFIAEKTRLFFDLNSKVHFEKHMNKLTRDCEWRREIGLLNRQEIMDYYSQAVVADSLLEILKRG